MTTATETAVRPIYVIANEIRNDWAKPNFGAVPYLNAMLTLRNMRDKYALDPASDIVRYFLSNATTWRGDTARRIKAELRAMLNA